MIIGQWPSDGRRCEQSTPLVAAAEWCRGAQPALAYDVVLNDVRLLPARRSEDANAVIFVLFSPKTTDLAHVTLYTKHIFKWS